MITLKTKRIFSFVFIFLILSLIFVSFVSAQEDEDKKDCKGFYKTSDLWEDGGGDYYYCTFKAQDCSTVSGDTKCYYLDEDGAEIYSVDDEASKVSVSEVLSEYPELKTLNTFKELPEEVQDDIVEAVGFENLPEETKKWYVETYIFEDLPDEAKEFAIKGKSFDELTDDQKEFYIENKDFDELTEKEKQYARAKKSWKYYGKGDFKQSLKMAGAVGGTFAASSTIMSNMLSQNSLTAGAMTGIGGALSALGAGIGSYFFGGLAGVGIGTLAGFAGGLIGMGMTHNKIIKTIPRKIVFDANFIIIPENKVYLRESKFKKQGDTGENAKHSRVGMEAKFNAIFNKLDNGKKIKYIPVGFYSKNAKQVDTGVLYVDYDKLDVNKLVRDAADKVKEKDWDDIYSSASPGAGGFGLGLGSLVGNLLHIGALTGTSAGAGGRAPATEESNSNIIDVDNDVIKELQKNAMEEGYRVDETASFALLFRNVEPGKQTFTFPNISCFRYDGITGATGPRAKPKIEFDWGSTFGSAKECSGGEDNNLDNAIYCDATQFTLELMHRLIGSNITISTSAELNKDNFSVLDEVKLDGSKLQLVNIEAKLGSINIASETGSDESDDNSLFSIYVNDKITGEKITLARDIPKKELDKQWDLGKDIPRVGFIVITKKENGIEKEVYRTKAIQFRINDKKVFSFKAKLMADGFTKDFKKDFKEYVNSSFAEFNEKFKNAVSSSLPDKIEFLPKTKQFESVLGYKLRDAGTYNVTVEVEYNDPSGDKEIFDSDGNLSANVKKINIYFELVERSTNPFYYIPLDGMVGIKNGRIERQGYGVDFALGDSITFVEQKDNFRIDSDLESESNPVARIKVLKDDSSMEKFNRSRRGIVLTLRTAGLVGSTPQKLLEFYPSKPYPVYMDWKKESDGDAWAFYTVYLDGTPVNTGPTFIVWRQYCGEKNNFDKYDCEFFDGSLPVDHQADHDHSGSKAKFAPTGQLKAYSYGLEVDRDSIIRDGTHNSVKMRGIIYAPFFANQVKIEATSASDELKFNNSKLESEYNESLKTVEDVLKGIENEWLCVSGSKNSDKISIWWNPAKVFDPTWTSNNNLEIKTIS